ncbi:phosphoribosylanthranilate isomerase [Acetobacter suratthaniensis]|uniref:N-(5'-phosphoribosyl)anthranilate isomerase n=1 Tax=Acetobacter suratthaniensis TaxID=1502841 RepID=A0ABS3LPX3_9PROT|nr:phosphoribosylanthranilate isomerase [Acetobacter suratthaniensis]MBO1329428.1 phosphoribosylanthranilate isomerase [Acetobacter suratthaniensis]MCX2567497.1 phosphoribosylanthranilate isomerase [Acetobacter suratthaniensis]
MSRPPQNNYAHTPVGVKICGLTEPAGFDACVTHGADWIGFVFFERSPRFVTPEQAATLSRRTVGGPERVGLFVEPDDALIENTLRHVPLDILQIYATDERARFIRQRFGLPVWLSRPVATQADLPATCPVERILIEPRPPKTATRPGGNAQRLDWSLLQDWQPSYNWMLAGGLNVETVEQAIRTTRAPAVDVSSGVEQAPGIKDPEAIARFIAHARSAGAP